MTKEAAAKKQPQQQDPWTKYEQLKADLPKDLSSEEYQAECKRIAKELGI